MNREQFLKQLEKKLKILNDEEKKDIIDEQASIIDEKIQNGKSEAEAIEDFGSVDELAKEILKAYKVNPDYNKNSETFEQGKESLDRGIKKAASWMGEQFSKLSDEIKSGDTEMTIENIFEIILKIFVLLIILNILRLPFSLISELGESIFASSIFPLRFIKYLWILVVEISYVLTVILIIFYAFREYLFTNKQENKKKGKKEVSQKSEKVTKNKIKAEPTEKNNALYTALKVLIIICIVFPLAMTGLGLVTALAFTIYLAIKGVFIAGPILLITGALIFVIFVINSITALLNNRKVSSWPLLAIFIIVLVGIITTIDWALGLKITQESYGELTEEVIYVEKKDFDVNSTFFDHEFIIDPTIPKDEVMIKFYYDEKYADLFDVKQDGFSRIRFRSLGEFKKYSDSFIDNLKDDKLYIPYLKIEIYAQEETIEYIKN